MLNVSEAPTPLKNTSHGRLHLSNTRVRGAYTSQTRKHSSRMRTARLETVHAPILLATTTGFPLRLENLEKWEGIFQSGKSQGILNRLEKSGKSQGKPHKILEN